MEIITKDGVKYVDISSPQEMRADVYLKQLKDKKEKLETELLELNSKINELEKAGVKDPIKPIMDL